MVKRLLVLAVLVLAALPLRGLAEAAPEDPAFLDSPVGRLTMQIPG